MLAANCCPILSIALSTAASPYSLISAALRPNCSSNTERGAAFCAARLLSASNRSRYDPRFSRPAFPSVTERFFTSRRRPALFSAITIWSANVFSTTASVCGQARGLLCKSASSPTESSPLLKGSAITAIAPNSATALRAPCNSADLCASAMITGSLEGEDKDKSCKAHITSLIAPELPAFTPLLQNSCTAVGVEPGVRIIATQRDTSQCAPISLTAVVSTDAAVVW